MSNKKRKNNRRNFFKKMAITGASTAVVPKDLMKMIVDTFVSRAIGQDSTTKAAIFFQLSGAATPWWWQLPLKPNGEADPFIDNPHLGNKIKNYDTSGDIHTLEVEHATHIYTKDDGTEIHLPYLWGTTIPAENDTRVPMTDMLENCMMTISFLRTQDLSNEAQIPLRP